MDLNAITISDFKTKFYRDFFYANQNPDQHQDVPQNVDLIQDIDIQSAFTDAQALLNQALFTSDANIANGYLYLSAHCLSLNIKAADSGVNSTGTGAFPVTARSVGSVSESYVVPDAYKDDPLLAQYAQTAYGQKYLQMVLAKLRGNMTGVLGGAHASGAPTYGYGLGYRQL